MADISNLTGADPIDQYLTRLSEVQQTLNENMPRLEQGINSILGDTQRAMIPNTMPVAPAMHRELGSYAGMANFNNPTPKLQNGSLDLAKSLIAGLGVPGAIPEQDAAHMVRKVGFGNGPGRQNFDRYHNHPAFERLGWNPYMDMETFYNDNTSWTEDLRRAGGQWFGLVGLGAKQMFSNWDNLLSADSSGDSKFAAEMNRRMAIASSSRGGVGGFFTNQVANSAYTMGVIGEIVAEELALAAATYASKGLGLPAALARTGQNLNRLFKLGEYGADASKIAQASKTVEQMKSTSSAFNAVNDVSSARKFWEGIKTNAQAAYEFSKPGLNFINPFDNTASAIKAFKTDAQGFAKLTDFAANSGTFGAFFRDAQGLNAALAESRLEGGFVQNDVLNNLLAEHYKKYAAPPTDKEAEAIISQAKAAGIMTTGMNMPAILYSNKIVFDKLFKGFQGIKEGSDSLGTMVRNYGAKKGEKAYAGFFDKGSFKDWSTVLKSGGIARQYIKNGFTPRNFKKLGLRYLSTNLTEGLQEVYQEAASKAMIDYYSNTFSSPERAGSAEFMSALGRGIADQFTEQGLETFASGFLMGGLVQGPQTLITKTAPQAVKDFRAKRKDRAAYEATKKKRQEDKTNLTDFLNNVAADPKKYYDPIYANVKEQKDFASVMTEADAEGNKKQHADAKSDALFSHVSTLIERGYTDLFTDQISELEKLSDTELADAFGIDPKDTQASEYRKDIRSRLKGVKAKVEDIQKRYEKYAEIQLPFKTDTKDPAEQFINNGVNTVKRMAIYNEYTFDQVTSRMQGILNKSASAGLGGLAAGKITSVLAANPIMGETGIYSQLDNEITALEQEYELYEKGTPDQKKLAKEKKRQLDALQDLKTNILTFGNGLRTAKAVNNKEAQAELTDTVHAIETLELGDIVEYAPKKKKAITGKVVKRTKTKATIEYTENGITKRKVVAINGKTLSISGKTKPSQTSIEFNEKNKSKALAWYREELGKSIREYVSSISGIPVKSTELNSIVADMVDYYELGDDALRAANFVNMMNDPEYFKRATQIMIDVQKKEYEQKKENLKKGLETYLKRKEVNKLLQDLFEKYQVFILPEEIQDLLDNKKIPDVFIDVNTLEKMDPSEPKHEEIVNFIKTWAADSGVIIEEEEEVTPAAETPSTAPETKPAEPSKPKGPAPITKQITPDMPLGDMPTEVVKKLRVQLEMENSNRSRQGKPRISDEDFPKWVQESPEALATINVFNIRYGFAAVKPIVKAEKATTVVSLTRDELDELINEDSTKTQIENLIKGASSIGEVDIIKELVTSKNLFDKIKMDLDTLTSLANNRIEQLTKAQAAQKEEAPNFDKLRIDSVVKFKKPMEGAFSEYGMVTTITTGENSSVTISVIMLEGENKEITLSKEEFENQIENMTTKSVYEVDQELQAQEGISAEEQEVSNESVNTSLDIDDTKLIEEDTAKAKELGEEEAGNDLFNNLDCE